ncbi:MAG: hypothetical protein RLZZ28_1725 [Bacteroidota bacterium]|jgi:glycosyltransferase involved in cell wall biosynthesis
MNQSLSVVIICRNEAAIIAQTIAAAKQVTDDIVVVDSGSTDGTQQIVLAAGVSLLETDWAGYGANKNKGVARAKNDWILSLDADEIPDQALIEALQQLVFDREEKVYNIRFRVFFANRLIRFGEWSNDRHIRLYNRKKISWNEAAVHEGLLFPANMVVETLKGFIHHYTSKDLADFREKTIHYAMLNARKYFEQGKKAGRFKCLAAPVFSFVKNYIFRLGLLDGKAGFTIARMNAWYTRLKYAELRKLNLQNSKPGN